MGKNKGRENWRSLIIEILVVVIGVICIKKFIGNMYIIITN